MATAIIPDDVEPDIVMLPRHSVRSSRSGRGQDPLERAIEAAVKKQTRLLKFSILEVCSRHEQDLASSLRKEIDGLLRVRGEAGFYDEPGVDVDLSQLHKDPADEGPARTGSAQSALSFAKSKSLSSVASDDGPKSRLSSESSATSAGLIGAGASKGALRRSSQIHARRTSKNKATFFARAFVQAYHTSAGKFARITSRVSTVGSSRRKSIADTKSMKAARSMWRMVNDIVQSQMFSMLCGLMILANCVLIGVETEFLTHNKSTTETYINLQYFLNTWYTLELTLRLIAHGRSFFNAGDGEWRWNWLDLVLVSTSLVDMLFQAWSSVKVGFILRSVRLMRMLRTLRILRSLRVFSTFRKMIFALATSMHTLFWSLAMLLLVVYIFATWITAGVADCLQGRIPSCAVHDDEAVYDLHKKFGSIGNSMFTLFMSIAEGYHWYYASNLLLKVDAWLFCLFLCYIMLTIFGVLNIVEAVFVESAILSTQHCRDLLVEEKMIEKENYVRQMRDIFKAIDVDDSGTVTLSELTEFLTDERLQLQMYLEALDLDATDTATLFKLLDWDDSGTIDIDEFCDGCMRLKGEARSFDINCLLYNVRKLSNHVLSLRRQTDSILDLVSTKGTPQAIINV